MNVGREARKLLRLLIGDGRFERFKRTARLSFAAVAPAAAATEQRAEEAWADGEAAQAEADWHKLAAMQPLVEDWPVKLSRSADMQGDSAAAEAILEAALARGVRGAKIAERRAFFQRWNRLSNSADDEAETIVRDANASPQQVMNATQLLLARGRLDGARLGLARITPVPELASGVRAQAAALSLLETAVAEGRAIIDGWLSPARDTILVHTPGADVTVIVFSSIRGDLGMPVNAVHAMLEPAKVNAIYLFDERKQFNLGGSTTLGRPYPAMIEALKRQLAAWGTRTTVMLGFSGPAFTALRAGLDLGAQGAILFGPVVTLHRRPEFAIENARGRSDDDARMLVTEKYLRRTIPEMMTQLPDELRVRTAMPIIEMYYGQTLPDMVHMNEVWTVPGIDFHPVEGFTKHECLSELVRRGETDILTRFIARVRAS